MGILITQNYMLWVIKRTVSMRRFFWASKIYVKTDGFKNFHNFTLKTLFNWTYGVYKFIL